MFENNVLRKIFEPKKGDETVEWSRQRKLELNDLYFSPNVVWVIISRRMRREGHVARMGRVEVCAGLWWGNLRARDHLEDPDTDGRII